MLRTREPQAAPRARATCSRRAHPCARRCDLELAPEELPEEGEPNGANKDALKTRLSRLVGLERKMPHLADNKYCLVAENSCWCFPRNQQQAVSMAGPNAYAPEFMADYKRRFRLAQALAATQMGAGCGPVMADFFAKFTAEHIPLYPVCESHPCKTNGQL